MLPLCHTVTLALLTPRGMLRTRHERHAPLHCALFEEVMQEAKLVRGGAQVEQPVLFDGDGSDGTPFDIARWDLHRSPSRYVRLIPGILIGPTTRRISGTVAALVAFAALVGAYNSFVGSQPPGQYPNIVLPLTPFELTSPVLGLLLVFRTDTSNNRFNFGCDAVWDATTAHRSLIRKLVAWTGREGTSTNAERAAALELIDGTLLLHGWIMGSYLRGKALKGVQEAQLLRFAAGRSEDLERIRSSGDKVAMTPYLAITALSLGVSRRLPSLTDQEKVAIDEDFGKITDALGKCEKLLRAPIPLGYTRYSVRFLWLWLTLLPFALAQTFIEFAAGTGSSWWADKPQPLLPVTMLFVSFIFLSIEDIAVQIEEPFAILPLIKCHKWLLTDVRRMRSLVHVDLSESSASTT